MSLRIAVTVTIIVTVACSLSIAAVLYWVSARRALRTMHDEARAAAERCSLEISLCHARNAAQCLPTVGPVEAPIPKDIP